MFKKFLIPLLITLGIILRFAFLDTLPLGLHQDEARQGLDAINLMGESYTPIYSRPGEMGKETTFIYFLMPFIRTLGYTELALRIPATIISVVTFIAFYFLAKEVYQNFKRKNLWIILSTTVFAFSSWNIIVGRLVFRANLAPLWAILSSIFLIKLLKANQLKSYLLYIAPVLFALGFYTYSSIFSLFSLFSIVLLGFIGLNKGIKRDKKVLFILYFLLSTFVVLLPLINYLTREPGNFDTYLMRPREVSVFNPIWTHKSEKELLRAVSKNIYLNLQAPFIKGDASSIRNYEAMPALDFPLNFAALGIFIYLLYKVFKNHIAFVKGKASLVQKLRIHLKAANTPSFFVISSFIVSLLPGILSYSENPHYLRIYPSLPFLILLIFMSIDYVLNKVKEGDHTERGKKYNLKLEKTIVVVVLLSCLYSVYKVFWLWDDGKLYTNFGSASYIIAKDIQNLEKQEQIKGRVIVAGVGGLRLYRDAPLLYLLNAEKYSEKITITPKHLVIMDHIRNPKENDIIYIPLNMPDHFDPTEPFEILDTLSDEYDHYIHTDIKGDKVFLRLTYLN